VTRSTGRAPSPRAALADLRDLEGRFRFLREKGAWFWLLLALGAAVRVYFVAATPGTHDVTVWTVHARYADRNGLEAFYARSDVSNHPPPVVAVMSALWSAEEAAGIPFRVSLRAPFAILDAANALLIAFLLRGHPVRLAAAAAYWVAPLPMIFSAYHGNTDTAVAFFTLLAVLAAARGRPHWAGAALGLGLWVKLPVILAAPALLFALPTWRERMRLGTTAVAVAAIGYAPALVAYPELLLARVFGYPGLVATSHGGTPIWGLWNVAGAATRLPESIGAFAALHLDHNAWPSLAPVVALAWLRRDRRGGPEIAATIGASLLLFYAFSMRLSFQYLAWACPFAVFLGPVRYALVSVVAGAYVYGVYAYVCDDPWLQGPWDWIGHPFFNTPILLLRDASVGVCLGVGISAVIATVRGRSVARG